MRLSNVGRSLLFGAIIALGVASAPAQADFIATETTTVTHRADNTYLYSYSIAVSGSSTVTASEFDLSLLGPIDSNSIKNPSDFTAFYSPSDPSIGATISFFATDEGIDAGSSGTFSFISDRGPTMGDYLIRGLDSSSSSVVNITGSTMVPGVPEPSSLLLCGIGLSGVMGVFARSRRRPTA